MFFLQKEVLVLSIYVNIFLIVFLPSLVRDALYEQMNGLFRVHRLLGKGKPGVRPSFALLVAPVLQVRKIVDIFVLLC